MSSSYAFRKFKNKLFFVLCLVCVIVAVVPLLSILIEVISRGAPQINFQFLTNNALNGGIGPAIQGSLIIIGLTSIIGIPIGILSGVYLSEFGENKYASSLRNVNNVLTEVPSIVVGITAFSIIIVGITGTYSPLAGAVALSFMLIPIVARTTEESMKLVPELCPRSSTSARCPQVEINHQRCTPCCSKRFNYRHSSCGCTNSWRNRAPAFHNLRQ